MLLDSCNARSPFFPGWEGSISSQMARMARQLGRRASTAIHFDAPRLTVVGAACVSTVQLKVTSCVLGKQLRAIRSCVAADFEGLLRVVSG